MKVFMTVSFETIIHCACKSTLDKDHIWHAHIPINTPNVLKCCPVPFQGSSSGVRKSASKAGGGTEKEHDAGVCDSPGDGGRHDETHVGKRWTPQVHSRGVNLYHWGDSIHISIQWCDTFCATLKSCHYDALPFKPVPASMRFNTMQRISINKYYVNIPNIN